VVRRLRTYSFPVIRTCAGGPDGGCWPASDLLSLNPDNRDLNLAPEYLREVGDQTLTVTQCEFGAAYCVAKFVGRKSSAQFRLEFCDSGGIAKLDQAPKPKLD
jgi:hypothetical protein